MTRLSAAFFSSVLALALLLASASAEATGSAYSSEPYHHPVRDAAENAVELVKFNNWLIDNFDSAFPERRQFLIEHLYSVIDSYVKQKAGAGSQPPLLEKDLFLAQCYYWAARMGVFGAHSVLESLDPEQAGKVAATAPPSSFSISLQEQLLVLTSSWGDWEVAFPYHFMVGSLQQLRTNNDLETQIAIISTGFGRHSGDEGYSQATIMVAYSPDGEPDDFQEYWLRALGIERRPASDSRAIGMPRFEKFDEGTRMWTEAVFPAVPAGAMVVMYAGLSGTYEHNRPHFQDFLQHLQPGPRDQGARKTADDQVLPKEADR